MFLLNTRDVAFPLFTARENAPSEENREVPLGTTAPILTSRMLAARRCCGESVSFAVGRPGLNYPIESYQRL